jgi:hypothetical protein
LKLGALVVVQISGTLLFLCTLYPPDLVIGPLTAIWAGKIGCFRFLSLVKYVAFVHLDIVSDCAPRWEQDFVANVEAPLWQANVLTKPAKAGTPNERRHASI